jgi:hypothetical protein
MVKYSLYIVLFVTCLSSCIERENLAPFIPEFVLHAHSSKVWILNSHSLNGEEIMELRKEARPTLTFFEDGHVFEQHLVHLGSNFGRKSIYSVGLSENHQDTLLSFLHKDNNKTINFKVRSMEHKSLILETLGADSILEIRKYIPLTKPF